MNGRIELRGLRALGCHGATAAERAEAQPFQVDIVIEADLSAAGASDDLADTIDYGAAVAAALVVITGESHCLLEHLAVRIAEEIVGLDDRAQRVVVTVAKLRPPVSADLESAAVCISYP